MKISFYSSTEEVLSELGSRIRAARISLPATQKEMAELTNLSQRTISNLETGKDVSFSTVIDVLRALGKLQSLELMIPEQGPRPSQLAALGKPRERASRRKSAEAETPSAWKWGDDLP
ncbi:helix-turn-helix transcriptional regulator [Lachnoclostridium sp. Marseille-P6806]|uniref:helix-turn-helix transcriptional regulator n=1 Tax=Lachnoclostridium sp. Marseille-P6806 TaxID=2364793 RepID=UPI0010306898|nr:helix-turn-helix transcriptional regulator [Lachnoclostridium sp. Marseille-P6806]